MIFDDWKHLKEYLTSEEQKADLIFSHLGLFNAEKREQLRDILVEVAQPVLRDGGQIIFDAFADRIPKISSLVVLDTKILPKSGSAEEVVVTMEKRNAQPSYTSEVEDGSKVPGVKSLGLMALLGVLFTGNLKATEPQSEAQQPLRPQAVSAPFDPTAPPADDRPQTTDHRPQTTDLRLETKDTRYKSQDTRPVFSPASPNTPAIMPPNVLPPMLTPAPLPLMAPGPLSKANIPDHKPIEKPIGSPDRHETPLPASPAANPLAALPGPDGSGGPDGPGSKGKPKAPNTFVQYAKAQAASSADLLYIEKAPPDTSSHDSSRADSVSNKTNHGRSSLSPGIGALATTSAVVQPEQKAVSAEQVAKAPNVTDTAVHKSLRSNGLSQNGQNENGSGSRSFAR